MSDHYRALTRTYRPRTFEDIVAQDHVSSTLRNAVSSGRLSHAYLFCGPRGVGKTTMARVLARVINNVDEDVDSEQLASTLNIFEMDAASNNGVDDVRNLRESVRVPPQSGRYKVYIIDEVHMLTKQAWNAFLKTLEEPPPYAIFIFATTEPNKLLPTILSRVQRFDFRRIRVDEIVSRVRVICEREQITIDDESLHLIARKADGGLRDALSLMDQAIAFCGATITYSDLKRALNTIGVDVMFHLLELIAARQAHEGMRYLHDLIMQGYDLQEFLVELLEHLRNLYMAKSPASLELIEATEGTRAQYQTQGTAFSTDDLLRMMHLVSEAQLRLRDAAQPRILFELAVLKLLQMPRLESLERLLGELQAARKALSDGASGKEGSFAVAPSPVRVVPPPPPLPPPEQAPSTPPPAPVSRPAPPVPAPQAPVTPAVPITAPAAAPVERPRPPEPDMFSLFDAPAIRKTESNAGASIHTLQGTGSITLDGNLALAAAEPVKLLSLSELLTRWEAFCRTAEARLGYYVGTVLRRSLPTSLDDRRVTLLCEDDFYQHTLEEHKTDLQTALKAFFGSGLGLAFRLAERTGKEPVAEDNYSQFQRLRDEDPRMRLLIDLFGAEPDF